MQKKSPKKPVSVHWKARITRVRKTPYIGRTLSLSAKHIHLESEWNLKEHEKVKVEVQGLHEGKKHLLTVIGVVRSSVLLSTGSSYGLDVMVEKITQKDQEFIDDYIKARENLVGSRS